MILNSTEKIYTQFNTHKKASANEPELHKPNHQHFNKNMLLTFAEREAWVGLHLEIWAGAVACNSRNEPWNEAIPRQAALAGSQAKPTQSPKPRDSNIT